MPNKKLYDVYLSLGSNLGDKEHNILQAIKYINERVGNVLAYSALYVTEPVGFLSENKFINAACAVSTSLSPLQLLDQTQRIEKEMGRGQKSGNRIYADRIIDIDILLCSDLIFENEELIIPHPHLHERSFVLDPLVEIAKDCMHPVLYKTFYELREELNKKASH